MNQVVFFFVFFCFFFKSEKLLEFFKNQLDLNKIWIKVSLIYYLQKH